MSWQCSDTRWIHQPYYLRTAERTRMHYLSNSAFNVPLSERIVSEALNTLTIFTFHFPDRSTSRPFSPSHLTWPAGAPLIGLVMGRQVKWSGSIVSQAVLQATYAPLLIINRCPSLLELTSPTCWRTEGKLFSSRNWQLTETVSGTFSTPVSSFDDGGLLM